MSTHPDDFRLVLEITPPAEPRPEVLVRRARRLGAAPDRINVIQRADRMPSLEAAHVLCDAGLPATWNLVTRGRSRAAIEGDLRWAGGHALSSLLCVRGDLEGDDARDTPTLRETVGMARTLVPSAEIGATLNPFAVGERVLKNLMGKLEAGADFVQTNTVFDLEALRPYAEEIRARMPAVRILPMVIPLPQARAGEAVARRLGIPAPKRWGWGAFGDLIGEIAASPLYGGCAIMTPRMDLSDEDAERIRSALIGASILRT